MDFKKLVHALEEIRKWETTEGIIKVKPKKISDKSKILQQEIEKS